MANVRDDLIALRVGTAQWLTDAGLADLMLFLGSHPGAIDEVVLFTSFTHPPLPLEVMAPRASRLAQVLPQIRAAGYQVGVNVLSSMGHHEENLPHSLCAPWPLVTDPDGRVSRGSYCPASPELLDYVRTVYTLVAQAGPDFVWVDDDVRLMGHMPVSATCFCEGCVARFGARHHVDFTRASLVAAMQGEPNACRAAWRARWLQYNRDTIAGLLRVAAAATHAVRPEVPVGFMTGDRFYEGYAFAEWAAALAGPDSAPVRWRPGGGFYSDDAYMGLVDKAHDVGRQVSQLPDGIRPIQSEIENFPYQRLRKSVTVTLLETVAHMAAGATGPAYNIIGSNDPLGEYLPFLAGIDAARPFLAAVRRATAGSVPVGIWPAWNRDLFADPGSAGDWLRAHPGLEALRRPYVLGELGLPIAYGPAGRRITVWSGPVPAAFTTAEQLDMLSGGVLMDVGALRTLEAQGLGRYCGVQVAAEYAHDMSEVLSGHPLNADFGGWSRDCRQSFWPQVAYHLAATQAGVAELAHLVDYAQVSHGSCMTAFQNELGGRVVVAGYYPWTLIHNLAKSTQLKAVCYWLSGGTLPVWVESFARAPVWARRDPDGRLSVVLINASLDPVSPLVLRVAEAPAPVLHTELGGGTAFLHGEVAQNGGSRLSLPAVAPWSAHLLQWR